MASICLTAQWSMGNVKDRYIHYEKAGDQFTGRSVTGISSVTKEFTISPVYQDYTDWMLGLNARAVSNGAGQFTEVCPSSPHLLHIIFLPAVMRVFSLIVVFAS